MNILENLQNIVSLEKVEIVETEGKGVGNTKIQPPLLINWFFTFNNYQHSDIETLETFFKSFCVKYAFQCETGENGTKHLQGTITLKKRSRYTEFGLNKKIHWEKPINLSKSYLYCVKEDTRDKGTFPYVMNYDYINLCEPLNIIVDLYPWQSECLTTLSNSASPRTISWYWENTGNTGKSSFCKYLCYHHNAVYIDEGKKSDLINIIFNVKNINSKSVIVIDIPRDNGNNVSYKAIESIKNGVIMNSKYETGMRLFNSPHIIIFSNFPPNKDKLSSDRWYIKEIEKNHLKDSQTLV